MLRNAVVVIEGLLIGLLVLFLAMTVFDFALRLACPAVLDRTQLGLLSVGAEGPSAGLWTYASVSRMVGVQRSCCVLLLSAHSCYRKGGGYSYCWSAERWPT